MGKRDALREAKEWLRAYEDADGNHPFAHPFYWAAFILVGDGT
jgi:CHAT domain-containing protein